LGGALGKTTPESPTEGIQPTIIGGGSIFACSDPLSA
jgi:hypothetical protein